MKKAIVVGASSGIGLEVAKCLLADGWFVGLMARREEMLLALAAEHPGRVVVERCDVTAPDAPERFLHLTDKLGGVHLYFHAAGIGKAGAPLDRQTELETLETNVVGFSRMVTEAVLYMEAHQGGHIAVISSIAGTKGLGVAASYSASKAFQNTYIQALEQQARARHTNIYFTDIRPGFVRTPLLAGSTCPLQMDAARVARLIVQAIYAKRHRVVIDWRYSILTALWRLIPNWLWSRIPVGFPRR